MRKTSLFTIIFILLCPIGTEADEKRPEANVNERYTVERIEYNGIDEARVSSALRDDAQKMAAKNTASNRQRKLPIDSATS